MGGNLAQLLAAPVFRAFDVDSDGRVLVGSDESGSMQLVEIAPNGTITALTALAGACTGRYVPGRRTVVVSHDDGGNERTQLSLLDLGSEAAQTPATLDDLVPLVRDPAYFHTLTSVSAERVCYLTNRRNGVDFDVVIRDLGTGAETIGYAEGSHVSEAALSPDGRRLALAVPGLPALSDRLLLVDLTAEPGPERVTYLGDEREHTRNEVLHWSPDSSALIVTSNRDRDFAGVARYTLAETGPADAGRWDWLALDDAHDLTGWLAPNGSTLLVERNDAGASVLTLRDIIADTTIREITLPATGSVNGHPLPAPRWSPDGRSIVMTFSGATVPGDAALVDVATGTVRALTDSVRGLAGETPREPEIHEIPTPDGERVPCYVYRAGATGEAALAGSSVLFIHGGPEGQARSAFNPMIQALALAGHTVLVPNVRGSTGYGKRWYSLDDVRLRLDSVADLAAIHAYLPSLGLDPARSALWGGSYGGYMVLAGLAFQPDLWAAGVDIVGISSLVTFLENTSPYRRAQREREYGSLAHDREFLREASPLTRIDDIRAPLFVIHGANDPRVPVSEARQLHAALVANSVECELLIYQDEGHGLAKRANREDAYPKVFGFLARHLAAGEGSVVDLPGA